MHARTAGTLAAIVAALVLAFAVDAASARNFSISSQSFRITWAELKFFDEGGAMFSTVCPVTMEGSFHSRTIAKVINSLIGHITRAIAKEASCREGVNAAPAAFLAASLPWHITYNGFQGTLPSISRLRVLVRGVAYEDTLGGAACLFTGEMTSLRAEFFRENGGVVTGFEFEHATTLPSTTRFCSGIIRGGLERLSTSVTVLGATTRITLTLI